MIVKRHGITFRLCWRKELNCGNFLCYSTSNHFRGRHYSPILERISQKGDLQFLEILLSHMQANAVELDELMYSHILRTCIKAKQPHKFIGYLNNMMKTIQVIQKDGPCIHVLQEFSMRYFCIMIL